MSWEQDASFLEATYIEHTIGNKDYKFWPVSVASLLKVRSLATPIAEALAILFAPTTNDVKTTRQEGGDGPDGKWGGTVQVEAISPELDARRESQRVRAFTKLVGVASDPKNHEVVGELLFDSMKDLFREGRPKPMVFMEKLPAPMLVELLIGFAKANFGALGPFADRARESLGSVLPMQTETAPETSEAGQS